MNSAWLVEERLERGARSVIQIQFERLTRPDLSCCHNINIGLNGRSPPRFQSHNSSVGSQISPSKRAKESEKG